MRKIVVLKPHEPLSESFVQNNFSFAAGFLEKEIQTHDMSFLPERPVRVPVTSEITRVSEAGSTDLFYSSQLGHNYALDVDFSDEDAEQRFKKDRASEVEGIYVNPEIHPFPTVCPSAAIGNVTNVENQIRIQSVHGANHKGRGVKIAVVDTGIDGTQINVVGGLNRPGFPAPGTTRPDHGTMVAFYARIAAPDAMIYDYPLLKSSGNMWVGFLSDAIRIYEELLALILNFPGPLVVNNSWGMYDRSQDRPAGDPQNYSANPRHPFNLIVESLVSAGADVFFATGNCGSTCPVQRCGVGDRGPANSIHGANSHPDVVCMAAVTIHDDLLGYSSEGPGGLHAQKPDLAATSHFSGSGVNGQPDTGTSAACPVASGVTAALRSKPSARTILPGQMKAALTQHARQPGGTLPGWNGQLGWGIVDAAATHSVV
jgi:subtilisin family serine protease